MTQPAVTRQDRRAQLSGLTRKQLVDLHILGAGSLMARSELMRWNHEELEAAILDHEFGPLATAEPEPASLPTWEEMQESDRGEVLLYLTKVDTEGSSDYATEQYPLRYRHPALAALDPRDASRHALAMFLGSIEEAVEVLGLEETERLCSIAEEARR